VTPAVLSVDAARQRARRLAWIALIAAAVSLLLVVGSALLGFRPPWTSWGLSFLLVANAAVFLVPQARQNPRMTQTYYRFSAVASLVIFVGIAVQFWHQVTR